MNEIWLIYSTFGGRDEALSAAQALLDARLIACANIHDGVTSLYRWEGKTQQAQETVMLAKTGKATLDAAIAELKRLHSYDVPCIVAWPASHGHAPFLQWVEEETS